MIFFWIVLLANQVFYFYFYCVYVDPLFLKEENGGNLKFDHYVSIKWSQILLLINWILILLNGLIFSGVDYLSSIAFYIRSFMSNVSKIINKFPFCILMQSVYWESRKKKLKGAWYNTHATSFMLPLTTPYLKR